MDKIECMKAAIESAKDSCEQVEMHLRWVEADIASLCDKIETSNLTDQQIGSELRALIYRRNDCAQCIKEYKEYIEATQRLLEKAQRRQGEVK